MARPRRLLFRHDDELVLCTGPRGRPFATITARGMGAIGANRPLIVWDEVDDVRVMAELPRGRMRRTRGIVGLMLLDGADADQTPDPDVFPDRFSVTWILQRRQEPKEAGFGYVPRGVSAEEVALTLDVILEISAAPDVDVRERLIKSVPVR